jgi:predicted nucleic acid-binding protein
VTAPAGLRGARYAILDTNIYIGHWELGRHDRDLELVRRAYIVRHSAVVLSELRRGARTAAARRRVEALARVLPVHWEPTAEDWWTAGKLVREIGDAHDWEVGKRRDFQNDALIALTARRHGAAVVTANAADFELLASELRIDLVLARDS